jgi:hypothetical protein
VPSGVVTELPLTWEKALSVPLIWEQPLWEPFQTLPTNRGASSACLNRNDSHPERYRTEQLHGMTGVQEDIGRRPKPLTGAIPNP